MIGRSGNLELAIASCMLEVGEPKAAYLLAVGVLHDVGHCLCDDRRRSWDRAQSLAQRAIAWTATPSH